MWFDTILWLAAIVAFIAVEAATTALVSVWFAIGAAAAMLTSFFTPSLGIQAAVFAVVSAIALAVMVPTLARHRQVHKPPSANRALCWRPSNPACRAASVWTGWTGKPAPKPPSRRARASA